MPSFGKIINESTVQVGDKTRIDVSKSFTDPSSSITQLEIQPSASDAFVDVTSRKYLDWAYSTEETATITLRINGVDTFTAPIEVLSETSDRLFSSDADLIDSEDEIMSFLRKGRNSFLDKHREAQRLILGALDRLGILGENGERITKEEIYDLEEVKSWSKFLTLSIIYGGLVNAEGDVYAVKSAEYKAMASNERTRSRIRLDKNKDGIADETIDMVQGTLRRK